MITQYNTLLNSDNSYLCLLLYTLSSHFPYLIIFRRNFFYFNTPLWGIFVRYIEVWGSILKYIDIATMGKLILLASPRACFCFAFRVSGFLVWSTVLCDCVCCVSVQGLAFSQGLVWSGLVLCTSERSERV